MLIREVKYTPFLCRLRLHRWHCFLEVSHPGLLAALEEVLRRSCEWGPVHVHACRRCGKCRLHGLADVTRMLSE